MRQLNGIVGAEPIPTTIHAEQFADRIAELMGVPLRVIRAYLIGVADGDTLNVRFAQKVKHDAETLRADSNESNVDLIAGRDMPDAAQHSAWHDRKTNCCGSLPQELAPRNRAPQ